MCAMPPTIVIGRVRHGIDTYSIREWGWRSRLAVRILDAVSSLGRTRVESSGEILVLRIDSRIEDICVDARTIRIINVNTIRLSVSVRRCCREAAVAGIQPPRRV